MAKTLWHWLTFKRIEDVRINAAEMTKWCEYLQHSAKQGDVKEMQVCYEKLERLFTRMKEG